MTEVGPPPDVHDVLKPGKPGHEVTHAAAFEAAATNRPCCRVLVVETASKGNTFNIAPRLNRALQNMNLRGIPFAVTAVEAAEAARAALANGNSHNFLVVIINCLVSAESAFGSGADAGVSSSHSELSSALALCRHVRRELHNDAINIALVHENLGGGTPLLTQEVQSLPGFEDAMFADEGVSLGGPSELWLGGRSLSQVWGGAQLSVMVRI